MDMIAVFPLFIAGVFLFYGYKHAYIVNETRHDGKLKTVKIPAQWRKLFVLKGENMLLWSVIEQIIALVVAFSSLLIGYILYTAAPARVYALFCVSLVIVGSTAFAINDFIWMRRRKNERKTAVPAPRRCFSCEIETAFHNKLPIRKVQVMSATQEKGQNTVYRVRLGRREYDAQAAKGYAPVVGTYAKAAYTKNKRAYSFILMSDGG